MGILDNLLSLGVDELAEGIAQDACGEAIDIMFGMCGNAGQESIVGDTIGDFESQIDAVANGEFDAVSSGHDEAVGIIMEAGNEIMYNAAQICQLLRLGGGDDDESDEGDEQEE